MNDWPAIDKWKSYLEMKSKISDPSLHVPVEVGGDYMSSNMRIVDMNFHKLLDIFHDRQSVIESSNPSSSQTKNSSKYMYIAQYDLSNIPDLVPDAVIPTIVTQLTNADRIYAVKFWLGGPDGTSSPCHFDPYNNMLCQVLGTKHVLLFPPKEKPFLYPYHNTTQRNTSQIPFSQLLPSLLKQRESMTNPSLNYTKDSDFASESSPLIVSPKDRAVNNIFDKFPGLSHATATLATLRPGDALYIPRGWFHFCSAPAASCSVNFWWI